MSERNQSDPNLRVEATHHQILAIALPISMAILIPQLNMLVNNIFLGNLNAAALANAGLTAVYYLIFAVAGNGLQQASQALFSKNAGAGTTDQFSVLLSQSIRLGLVLSVFFLLMTWFGTPILLNSVATTENAAIQSTFLRIRIFGLPFLYLFQIGNAFLIATLNSRWLIVGFSIQAIANIVLDYALIFGHFGLPACGFLGAAWASVLSECIGMITVWLVIQCTGLRKRYRLLESFQYHQKQFLDLLKISAPLIFQFIISLATWFVFFLLIEERGTQAKAISNTMRNVFGIAGIFVWAFAGTSNNMIANLIGQERHQDVLPVLKRISLWSFCLCLLLVLLLNGMPEAFFALFGQNDVFTTEGVPVIRIVSVGMLLMSIAVVWLNGVTGTGKTNINLLIEVLAIGIYLLYTLYFMKYHYVSLAMAWSNELVYWLVILIPAWLFMRWGNWQSRKQ
ncbi:MAG: MATE family efflux transporter [Ferruginibacter sp.]